MDYLFSDEEDNSNDANDIRDYWKVLIVDDEPEVHAVTKMALKDFMYKDKGIEFLSAHSGKEAETILKQHPDISVVFLDVVMETDDAGLKLVGFIRKNLENHQVRIILRTGQTGSFPEYQVVQDYDINDYKNKTELTSQKLRTTLLTAIRGFNDICTIEKNRKVSEDTIEHISDMINVYSKDTFDKYTYDHIMNFLNNIKVSPSPFEYFLLQKTCYSKINFKFTSEKFFNIDDSNKFNYLNMKIWNNCLNCLKSKTSLFEDDYIYLFYGGNPNAEDYYHNLFVIKSPVHYKNYDLNCLSLLSLNLNNYYQNLLFKQEVQNSQESVINLLSEALESRSKESGNHIIRVASICELLALKLGFSYEEAKLIKIASPLHDLGKIGVPDNILHKKGKLNSEERKIMETHVNIGYDMLKNSKHKALKYGAIIAQQHHEKWNGNGYPNKLKGKEIHILGRITAIADVFDALMSKRCYKEAWDLDKALNLISSEKGEHFDPSIVEVFLDNIDKIIEIRNKYPDK